MSTEGPGRKPRPPIKWAVWIGLVIVGTGLMMLFRGQLEKVHVALLYLLLVLGASQSGRALGLFVAVITFLCFNYFFLLPYHTLAIADQRDWIVLVTYLVTAGVAAQLLSRADREAAERLRLAGEAEEARALEETNRLKDALLAAVSHDMRTPLTTIKALAEDMAAEGDERALQIVEQGDRLGRFVSDLLDYSSLRGGAVQVRPELNAVEDLFGAAIQQVSGVLAGRELKAELDTSEAVLLARFDFVHTLRIVVNLLENAHKYSPSDRPIGLTARREDSRVLITVTDHGPGIPETERERIFQPFYRLPGNPRDAGGAGLGLAIAASLAQAQGGQIRCEANEGGGSRFILSLPAGSLPEFAVAPEVS